MSKPTIDEAPGVYRFSWEQEQVQIAVARAREYRERTTAELTIQTTAPGVSTHLHRTQLNLNATRSLKELASHLKTLYAAPDWTVMLEQLCYHVLERLRRGEPVVLLSTAREARKPEWALNPIMPRRNASILFGKGGSGKSILAMLYCMVVQVPLKDNRLGLVPLLDPLQALYLDWEMNEDDAQWRLSCIARGVGVPEVSVRYRRCAAPLADDVEAIQEIMLDERIDFVVIDSIFGAAGGDLNATEPAQRMFQALRSLNTTSLLIAHCAKNADANGREATPFGTAFYWNEARSIWEIQKVQDVGDSEIEVGLFHKKSNFGGLHKPIGYRIAFGEDTIMVSNRDVATIGGLEDRLPARTRIANYLKDGKASVKQMAAELSIDGATVRQTLHRMEERGAVMRVGTDWGLAERNGSQPIPRRRSYEKADDEPF